MGELNAPSAVSPASGTALRLTEDGYFSSVGLDLLRVGLDGAWESPEREQAFHELVQRAWEERAPLSWPAFDGTPHKVLTREAGRKFYRLLMRSADGNELQLLPKTCYNHPISILLKSRWHLLHSPSWTAEWVRCFAESIGFNLYDARVQELHVRCDTPARFILQDTDFLRGHSQKGRRLRTTLHRIGERFTGFESGYRDKPCTFTVYDRREWERNEPSHWTEAWSAWGVRSANIWRVEARFKREMLARFGIDEIESITKPQVLALWGWFTSGYLVIANKQGKPKQKWQRLQRITGVALPPDGALPVAGATPRPFRVPRMDDVPRDPVYARVPTGETGEGRPKTRVVALDPRKLEANTRERSSELFGKPALADVPGIQERVDLALTKARADQETKLWHQVGKEMAQAAAEVERPAVQHTPGAFRLFVPAIPDGVAQILSSESDFARTLYALSRHDYPLLFRGDSVHYAGTIVMAWGTGYLTSEVRKHVGRLVVLDRTERNARRAGSTVQKLFDLWDADTAFHAAWLGYVAGEPGKTAVEARRYIAEALRPYPVKLHFATLLNERAMIRLIENLGHWLEDGPTGAKAADVRRDLAALYRLLGARHERVAVDDARHMAAVG